jgi:Anti-sigma-K factor rskA/Putative zinc-finger
VTGHPQDDLPGLLGGELPPAATVAVDRHLAGCDPCRRDLAAVAVAASSLRDAARLLGTGGSTDGGDDDPGPGQTVALAAPAGGASAEARLHGAGDDQIMTMTARGLPRPRLGAHYEVWLVDGAGRDLPLGMLAPTGEGVWSLPAEVAARYRAIQVTLEPAGGDPARPPRTVLRGRYA